MRIRIFILAALLPALSGCGKYPMDRALSGAGIGAAEGAAVTAIISGNPFVGAAVGGVAGGVIGAVTPPDMLYLGHPLWWSPGYGDK